MNWGTIIPLWSASHVVSVQLIILSHGHLPQQIVSCWRSDAADAVRQAEAALQQGKTLILFNPLLRDVASPDGVMGVR